ncbi:hypothetical protein CERZMDRAFT_102200 [Cercospora zeae-maydis SCOH1-5]|uniref:N-acetyltransferase domain-containing protein n=1 Tax=Cercospora zeae-maydis SCOH1-5 TaxID=717836 RepID=A0A6A6F2N6_9PEZI|nr:hypothetical protein CERZMDRAFT_102200 [Cercospora zeae-maydis SCOH1-5]
MSSPQSSNTFDVCLTSWNDKDAAAVRASQRQDDLSEFEGEPIGSELSETDVPVFVVVTHNVLTPIACGGLRPLSPPMAEINTMYVVPEFRGRAYGAAYLVLHEQEVQARERGWSTLRLETGVLMLSSRKFYERHGFGKIPFHSMELTRNQRYLCAMRRFWIWTCPIDPSAKCNMLRHSC